MDKAVICRPVTVDKAVICRSVTVDKRTSSSSFVQCLNMLLIFNLCKSKYFPTQIVVKRPVYVIFYIFDIQALQALKNLCRFISTPITHSKVDGRTAVFQCNNSSCHTLYLH